MSRQDSVRNGLAALKASGAAAEDLVLIRYDAARPFVSAQLVNRAVAAGLTYDAAISGLAVTDTIKQVEPDGRVLATPERASLRAVQTPQAFRFGLIAAAHEKARAAGANELTDDAAVAEWAGHDVFVFAGETDNMKLTSAEDLVAAGRRLYDHTPDCAPARGSMCTPSATATMSGSAA